MADRKDINALIDRLLREQRPDRYEYGDAWLDDVAECLPDDLVPADEVRRYLKRKLVSERETVATRAANRLLRQIGETGQLVLDWWEQANDPIAIETEFTDDNGKVHKIKERVTLRAASPDDFRAFSRTERERADRDHKARLAACDGADFVADAMERAGQRKFADWADAELAAVA